MGSFLVLAWRSPSIFSHRYHCCWMWIFPPNPLILDRSDQDLPREPSNSQIVIPVTLHSFFVITLFGSKFTLERIFKTPPVYSDRWFCSLQSPELKTHSRCPSLCSVFACSWPKCVIAYNSSLCALELTSRWLCRRILLEANTPAVLANSSKALQTW